jgi:hypothetical protein
MFTTFQTTMKNHQSLINKSGAMAADRSSFVRRNTGLFGPRRVITATRTIPGRLAKPGRPKPKSTLITIGEGVPEGFGKQLNWDPADAGLAAVVFLNAGDHLGVMISGVKRTDTIEIVSAVGIASFSEDTENKGVGALIGLIATGAEIGAASFGAPQLAPFIEAAESYAKTQFEEKKVKTKRRDPFGEDPGSGHKARQEGGVLISMPEARQAFYSGTSDHKDRWIKEPGTRDSTHLPAHVKKAFFLQGGTSNEHRATADGDILIYPWDHKFEDNFGFYRLHVLLRRGAGVDPVIE